MPSINCSIDVVTSLLEIILSHVNSIRHLTMNGVWILKNCMFTLAKVRLHTDPTLKSSLFLKIVNQISILVRNIFQNPAEKTFG